jgi:hypothetical protein
VSEWPRLKWHRGGRGFKAYPVGDHHPHRDQRYTEIWLQASGWNTDSNPHLRYESWAWVVRWEGWFSHHGFAPGKQEAADMATEQWWKWVQTELPRNVDLEVAMIVARALVSPMPNSLLCEENEYLQKIQWWLNEVYRTASKPDEAPPQARELTARISEELHRRRLAQSEPEKPAQLSVSGGYRRRRRR